MATAELIPALFEVSREYQFDPNAIELGHTSATERLLYAAIAEAARLHSQTVGRPLAILDSCAASGGCANEVLKVVSCDSLCLVDNEHVMCEAAKAKEWPAHSFSVQEADAVTWRSEQRFDLILMNSAYHHIEDERKAEFLWNMASHLKSDGRVLVGEHFLPPYQRDDLASYRHSVMQFYTARIGELEAKGDPSTVVDVIRQTGRYCWERRYEYQVSMHLFKEHVERAHLEVIAERRLWPSDAMQLPQDTGTFLVVLGRTQTGNERRTQ